MGRVLVVSGCYNDSLQATYSGCVVGAASVAMVSDSRRKLDQRNPIYLRRRTGVGFRSRVGFGGVGRVESSLVPRRIS